MDRYLVTLTDTHTWRAVKINVAAESESHALHRALLVEKHKYKDHEHHMVTISVSGCNPSVTPDVFEYIEDKEVEIFERIDYHQRHPLLER
ncbi:MAG: hypothetical protein R3268_03505 [Acidiferrobacterales bacterium]|nr:hypothetical protein [Acidiferrobacterales bacterium]